MRFIANGPIIPDLLLSERDAGRVVFLCGAGVSMPSGMPSFLELTNFVIDYLGPDKDSEIRKVFSAWAPESKIPITARTPLDQIFNLLQLEYGRDAVGKLVSEKLAVSDPTTPFAKEHGVISRISSDQENIPQVVTTNFDLLFEHALGEKIVQTYVPPTFPDLRHNVPISGITYLHGRLSNSSDDIHDYVLSSADFGRAYLVQGWATSFIQQLLRNYTVVLLGYQAEDPPVKYLLQGLNSSQDHNRNRLFAFDQGDNEVIEAKWRDRGVTPIAYPESHRHQSLWDTLDAWADRSDSPTKWRSSVLDLAKKKPSTLKPHERGMVSHLLRTPTGTKLFADATPSPPIDWLCVFDRHCRFAQPSLLFGEETEQFDPLDIFGLDDDPPRPADREQESGLYLEDLIAWRHGDESLDHTQRLAGFRPEYSPMPSRLSHLARWMLRHFNEPALAWWVARQTHLHPKLLEMLKQAIEDSDQVNEHAHTLWAMIFEVLEGPTHDTLSSDLFQLRHRLKTNGWNSSVIRAFETATEPTYRISPPSGIYKSRPPTKDWSCISWGEIAEIDLRFPSLHDTPPEVPDSVLIPVYTSLQRNLIRATERLHDAQQIWLEIGTLYPEIPDDYQYIDSPDAYIHWFVKLLARMIESQPKLLLAHIDIWPASEHYIFDKLRLVVWNQDALYEGKQVSKNILSLQDNQFWKSENERELLFLLRSRWADFSLIDKESIALRVLDGPHKYEAESEEQYHIRRSQRSLMVFGWLFKAGCEMPVSCQEQWIELKNRLPNWEDSWIDEVASTNETKSGFVSINDDAAVLNNVPINQIIAVAQAHSRREFGELVDHKPFLGLIKDHPNKAFMALSSKAKHNEFPAEFWGMLLQNWPDDASDQATRMLHRLVCRLPSQFVLELRGAVSHWINYQFPKLAITNESLAYAVFDSLTMKSLSGGSEATKSGLGETTRNGVVVPRSRRTQEYAINSPIGKATEGLLSVFRSKNLQRDEGLPLDFTTRVDRLLTAQGEGADHVVCILTTHIAWLNSVDPDWISSKILPWFNPTHNFCEPAWNGMLFNDWCHIRTIFDQIKDNFLSLMKIMRNWKWRGNRDRNAYIWIVQSSVFTSIDGPHLTFEEARNCLRHIDQEGLTQVIWFLGRVGAGNDNGWEKLVIPFIRKSWPKEKRYQTEKTSQAWVSMLDNTADHFPAVFQAVREFLRPIRAYYFGLYRFINAPDKQEPFTSSFPNETLDLLSLILPDGPRSIPYDLSQVLNLLLEAKPSVATDRRYERLRELDALR